MKNEGKKQYHTIVLFLSSIFLYIYISFIVSVQLHFVMVTIMVTCHRRNVMFLPRQFLRLNDLRNLLLPITTFSAYRTFSLTWSASMLYNLLEEKKVFT